MEDIASYAFTDCHAQIHIEAYSSDAHTGIMLTRRSEIRGIMVVVVAMMRVTRMASGLNFGRRHGHWEQWRC